MGHLVTYTENEAPAPVPDFLFEQFVFPAPGHDSFEKVRAATTAEARHLWKCCENFGKRFRTALDVGANVGTMTYALALHFNRVWAFEPWPENYQCLETNAAHMPPCDIHLRKLAVSHGGLDWRNGFMYSKHKARRDAHLQEAPKGMVGDCENVSVWGLDEFMDESTPIDLIKLDVGGTDLDVILGAERIIRQWRPLIYIEAKKGAQAETAAYMELLKYRELANSGHNYLYGASD